MQKTVRKMSLSYDPINEDNTFSSGDFITGRVTLELSKVTTISSLSIKAKGEADVHWTEKSGDDDTSYSAHERYFKLKQFFIHNGKGKDPSVVAPGTHVYPFIIQIPEGNMPSSFKGLHGKIVYTLEAKLSRAMRLNKTERTEFTFHSKAERMVPHLVEPWSGSVEKKMKLFTSGHVSMSVTIEKTGYMQGEQLKVLAEIENNSSRALAPKFALDQRYSFIAGTSTNNVSKRIFKVVGQRVPSSTRQSVTEVLSLPPDLTASLFHCSIIKVEYTLQVYMDVPYAKDPTVKVPLVILPNTWGIVNMTQPSMLMGFEPYENNNQAGWNSYPPPTASGGYLPQTAPGGYSSKTAPGGYPLQTASGMYLLQTDPGAPATEAK
ncbi:arrestin domain-containing protein 3-like isoform X2 [Anguilla rostrata]|uniref:arrestin domain-containing protein 3-like isoform X2 n=1 Tax=Anguilla rostrata TaxID=7938 RepID=UPI0030D1339A